METRKVQQTGGSSFIVSLPKEWIEKHDIKPKDSLGIITQPDGNLLITPQISSEKFIKIKKIDVDDIKDYNFLFRLLIGAYIIGYSIIELESSKKFEPFIRDCVNKFREIAIGPEIVEESNNYILIKDLLNPKEMPFDKTIRRMYILVESMHKDAIEALKTDDKDLAERVIERDNDIDRLYWLIGRQSHIILRDILLCQKMGITLEMANHFQFFSKALERIGDHAVKIAKNVILIIDKSLNESLKKEISNASTIALNLLSNSLDAWLQRNIILANNNIELIPELINACENIIPILDDDGVETSIAVSYIIESIRRTGEYAADISEIIINTLINERD